MSSHTAHNSATPRLGNQRAKHVGYDSKMKKLRRKIADRSRRINRGAK